MAGRRLQQTQRVLGGAEGTAVRLQQRDPAAIGFQQTRRRVGDALEQLVHVEGGSQRSGDLAQLLRFFRPPGKRVRHFVEATPQIRNFLRHHTRKLPHPCAEITPCECGSRSPHSQ